MGLFESPNCPMVLKTLNSSNLKYSLNRWGYLTNPADPKCWAISLLRAIVSISNLCFFPPSLPSMVSDFLFWYCNSTSISIVSCCFGGGPILLHFSFWAEVDLFEPTIIFSSSFQTLPPSPNSHYPCGPHDLNQLCQLDLFVYSTVVARNWKHLSIFTFINSGSIGWLNKLLLFPSTCGTSSLRDLATFWPMLQCEMFLQFPYQYPVGLHQTTPGYQVFLCLLGTLHPRAYLVCIFK